MQSVRLHVSGDGEVWALSKCSRCGEVDKHTLRLAATGTVPCKKCGHQMDMTGATVEAVDAEVSRPSGSRIGAGTREGKDHTAAREQLLEALKKDGLPGAVSAINQTVPHRYTGIFLKDGPLLQNVALHDKQDPAPELWAPFPLGQSFCNLIVVSGDPLTVREAHTDPRVDVMQHPAGDKLQAYCGVPLIDSEGEVLGTLCHLDEKKIDARIDLVAMLQIPFLLRDYLPLAKPPD
ncbi:MAG: GAF domain-containing protein [Casimicrobiaceae bacterium]